MSETASPGIPRNDLAVGDCLALMASWPENSVDLIFADPPYNIGYNYDQYDDNRSDEEYVQWTCDWVDACTRLLKPSGSLYILIGDEYAAEARLHLKQLQKQAKLLFRNWIIWHYSFGQRCSNKFNRSHAHLLYCVGADALNKKGRPRADLGKNQPFTFHYDAVALPSARMTTYGDKRTNPKGKLPDDTWLMKNFPDVADWHTRPRTPSRKATSGPTTTPGTSRASAAPSTSGPDTRASFRRSCSSAS